LRLISPENWPYLLRRVIDRHQGEFYQSSNPMTVAPTQQISFAPSEHPYFQLDWVSRIQIIYWLVQWSMSDFQPIRDKIDIEMKLKGRSSSYCVNVN
jgi:hypothetical protein